MLGRECHQRVENHQQKQYIQMENTRSTIDAHTTINGQFMHQQIAKDSNQLGERRITKTERQLRDKTSKTRSKHSSKLRQHMMHV
jgi:hypothetical protein